MMTFSKTVIKKSKNCHLNITQSSPYGETTARQVFLFFHGNPLSIFAKELHQKCLTAYYVRIITHN